MIVKSSLAALVASGLVIPEKPALVFPKPAIIRAERALVVRDIALGMPVTMGMMKSRFPEPTISYRTQYSSNNTAATTHTVPSVDIGAASPNRMVVVVGVSISGSASSCTVGSVNLTLVGTEASLGGFRAFIWHGLVDTGTTATVTLTFGASCNTHVGIYTVDLDGGSTTRSDYITGAIGANNGFTLTGLNVPTKGVAVAAFLKQSSTDHTWTNATRRSQGVTSTGNSGSTAESTTPGNGLIGVTGDGANGLTAAVAASWGASP